MSYCRASLALLAALAACGSEQGTEGGTPLEPSVAALNKGIRICSWGLGDYATGDSYLASGMNPDGTYQIGQYVNFPESGPLFYIDSKPTAGLTTVYGDSLVIIKGNLPASSYSSWPWQADPPPADTMAITLALDLRLVVTPRRGTGLHPAGQGSTGYTRFMILSGAINGVQIASGSGISDVPYLGRYSRGFVRGAKPFDWQGGNGGVQFCTH